MVALHFLPTADNREAAKDVPQRRGEPTSTASREVWRYYRFTLIARSSTNNGGWREWSEISISWDVQRRCYPVPEL